MSRFFYRMRVDAWTAEVVTAFRVHDIRAVLLKGPAIARWLYADVAAARSYDDADLLVRPGDVARAEEVLRGLGFEPRVGFGVNLEGLATHARAWIRRSDRANVDLHRTLHGMESVSADGVWAEIAAGAETLVVGGVGVEIPGPAMRTFHIVLHARSHGSPASRAAEDLRRAIRLVDQQTWRDAAQLARIFDKADEMGNELCKTSDGAQLAARVDLPSVGTLRSYIIDGIKQSELPPSTYLLWSFASMATYRDKARFIVQKQFPPRSFMEKRYAIASKGAVGLAGSYGVRAIQSCAAMPGACRNWIRFNRHLRGIPPARRPRV